MKSCTFVLCFVGALLLGVEQTRAQATDTNTTLLTLSTNAAFLGATNSSALDRSFVRQAAASSELEISLGQIAQTNSTNGDVQSFGQQLVADHTLALEQDEMLATNQNLTLTGPSLLQERQVAQLSALSTNQFDAVFLPFIIQTHILDIQRFMNAAYRAQNPDTRTYARAQLPVLTEHLLMALELREMLFLNTNGVGSNAASGSTTNSTATSSNGL